MKRLLCALLALVLALACVPAMADVARVTEEPKEFTVWAAYNPTYQTECMEVFRRSYRRSYQLGAVFQ